MKNKRIQKLDQAASTGLSNLHIGNTIDRSIRGLSKSADYGRLWMGVSVGLALTGKRGRTASAQGIISLVCSSAVANLVLKPIFGGPRPDPSPLSRRRRLKHQPVSGTFPSGHSASAAAFATGASLACPSAAPVLIPLAAGVAYSRMHTGAHWLSDVLAGSALGAAIGFGVNAAGIALSDSADLTQRSHIAPTAEVPCLPEGAGLIVIVNPNSGPGTGPDSSTVISQLLPQAKILLLDDDLHELLEEAVTHPTIKALGVCGGDGTVGAAAAKARESNLPLAVFPGGTLNHFAKAIGVETLEDTARVVAAGSGRAIDVADLTVVSPDESTSTATVLNTFSLGAYSEMVQIRDELQDRFGRWFGGVIAAVKVAVRGKPTIIEIDGSKHPSWLTFIGVNQYLPAGLAPLTRQRLDTGVLDVRDFRADAMLTQLRFVGSSLLGVRGANLSRGVHRAWHRLKKDAQPILSSDITVICWGGESPNESNGVDLAYDGEVLHVPAEPNQKVDLRLTMASAGLITYAP